MAYGNQHSVNKPTMMDVTLPSCCTRTRHLSYKIDSFLGKELFGLPIVMPFASSMLALMLVISVETSHPEIDPSDIVLTWDSADTWSMVLEGVSSRICMLLRSCLPGNVGFDLQK